MTKKAHDEGNRGDGPVSEERLDPAVLRLAGILLVGILAPLFDATIVNVALDALGRDLDASVSTIQWVVTGYLLALGMAIPLSGWSVARFGGKRTWMVSLGLFLAGSVLAGAAWNVGSLIAFRVLQGIGGGLMIPTMQTLVAQAAGGRNLGRLMAVASMPALVGPILGPVLGGLIVGNLSWRWIFFFNVPVCLATLVLAWRGMPAASPQGGQRLDVPGLALLSPAVAAVIYGLAQVGRHGGFADAAVVVPLAVGAGLLAAFAVHALRTREEPVVDLRLLRVRSFGASTGLLFLAGLSLYGALLLLPLYYQQVRGEGVLAAGLLLVLQGIGALLIRVRAGEFTDRIGARPVVLVGIALAAAGTSPFALAGPHTDQLLLGVALIVRGAGLGAVTVPAIAAAYQGLHEKQIPHASSARTIVQQVGGAFGAAVLAVILENRIADHAPAGGPGLAAAFDHAFWWSVGFTVLAFIPAFLLPRRASDRGGAAAGTTGASPDAP